MKTMSDFDQTSLYEFVEALHADIHLEDLDEATLISAKIRRSERIDAAFSIGSELNRLARFFSSQRFEREVAALKESIPKSVMDDWIVAHTDDVLGGKIEFVRRISEGATAEVWEAKSRLVDKAIAVKCLRPNKISDDTFRTALALAEIQNLFKFRHPNVVHVYEAGRLQGPHGQMGTFLVMEYLEGCTLEEWVAARRTAGIPVTEEEAATICRVIANALYSLHSFPGKGILHLDIKPSNIMVLGGPNAKADAASIRIIDFGSFGRNVSGGHVGTVEYMADERHLPNAEPNASWDIYSTGGLLCYLLTGKHPPRKDQSNPVFEWSMIRSDDLRKVCQIAMAANPSSRYPSIQQLQEDLAAWLYDYPLLHASVSQRTRTIVPSSGDGATNTSGFGLGLHAGDARKTPLRSEHLRWFRVEHSS
jgi:serine/threonine protein kinase